VTKQYSYKAFLSYSHADRKRARWLHRSLESYRTPSRLVGQPTPKGPVPARLSPIFRDREELASSPDLNERVSEALQQSENLVVICSPQSAKSRWVNKEVELFKSLGRSGQVFCLIVDGDPTAEGADNDCFPPAVRARYDDDGSLLGGSAEPIAADARKAGDGNSLALIKIQAGLLGTSLDDLRQRELHRRQRRMAAITLSSMLIAAVTVALASTATLARDEAEQRRSQAEELLNFMVSDLRDNLEPIGRLDLLEDVVRQAEIYFASVDVNVLSDAELLRQAEVITQLGEIRFSQLQYEEARQYFMEAFERSSLLYDKHADDDQRLFNRGQAEFWVGYVHWRSGNFDLAAEWLARYRDTSIALMEREPTNPDWIREVGFGYHNYAVLSQERGDIDTAADGFRAEIQILEGLLESDNNVPLQRDLFDARTWLGNVAILQGDLDAALAQYSKSVTAIDALLEQDPGNATLLDDLAYGEFFVAEVLLMMRELDKAEAHIARSRQTFDALVARDASNTDWIRASAKPLISEARVHLARGETVAALERSNAAIERLENIAADGKVDHNVLDHLADAYSVVALAHRRSGESELARKAADVAREKLQVLRDQGRLTGRRPGMLANVYVLQARLSLDAGQTFEARQHLAVADELLRARAATTRSPYDLDPWARVLALQGKDEEADKVIAELGARRYLPLVPWSD
jgi:tetratricopeptide (TPR) repeat protein